MGSRAEFPTCPSCSSPRARNHHRRDTGVSHKEPPPSAGAHQPVYDLLKDPTAAVRRWRSPPSPLVSSTSIERIGESGRRRSPVEVSVWVRALDFGERRFALAEIRCSPRLATVRSSNTSAIPHRSWHLAAPTPTVSSVDEQHRARHPRRRSIHFDRPAAPHGDEVRRLCRR